MCSAAFPASATCSEGHAMMPSAPSGHLQELSNKLDSGLGRSDTSARRHVAPAARHSVRYGRMLYLAVNTAVLVFLLAPIAIVFVFALNPTPFIQFPPVG